MPIVVPEVVSVKERIQDNLTFNGWTPDTSDVVAGDLMLFAGSVYQSSAGDKWIPPAGWTADVNNVDIWSGSGYFVYFGWKVAEEDAEAVAFAVGNPTLHNCSHCAQFLRVQGDFDPDAPILESEWNFDDVADTSISIGTVNYDADGLLITGQHVTRYTAPAGNTVFTAVPTDFELIARTRNSSITYAMAHSIQTAQLQTVDSGDTGGLASTVTGTIHKSGSWTAFIPGVELTPASSGSQASMAAASAC